MGGANIIEVMGAIFAGLITIAIASVLTRSGSQTANIIKASGDAFASDVNAASNNKA